MAFILLSYAKFNPMHAAFGYFLHWMYPILIIIAHALPKVKSEKRNKNKIDSEKTDEKSVSETTLKKTQ